MTPKKFIAYDDPAHLFRLYQAWECQEDGGLGTLELGPNLGSAENTGKKLEHSHKQ